MLSTMSKSVQQSFSVLVTRFCKS